MARIIGRDEKFVKTTSCRKCAAKIEYTLSETVEHTDYDYGGGVELNRYLTCPGCGADIRVG